MSNTAFKPVFLHGALVAIGFAAATGGNYLTTGLTNLGLTAEGSGETQAEQSPEPNIDVARDAIQGVIRQARSEQILRKREAPNAAKEVVIAEHAS